MERYDPSQVLCYHEPSGGSWYSALPVGNGHLGAMLYGEPRSETVALNEDSCYWGGRQDRIPGDAGAAFEKVRSLIMEGRVGEADELWQASMNSSPRYSRPYVPLGYLNVTQMTGSRECEATGYERRLDLRTGLYSAQYELDGKKIRTTAFVSHDSDVFVYRYESDRPLSLFATITRRPYDNGTSPSENGDGLTFRPDLGRDGMLCSGRLLVRAQGENASVRTTGGSVVAENALSVTFFLTAVTSYYQEDPEAYCRETLKAADALGYETLKDAFVRDYQSLYGRMSLRLGPPDGDPADTPARIGRMKEKKSDPSMDALLFNYARYLLIASSRPGTLPANLQGIWSHEMDPPWDCNYTLNINLQMNYWMADAVNLAELREPVFDLLDRLRENGRAAAAKIFGARGSVTFHNTDIYGDCAPASMMLPCCSIWPFGQVWEMMDLWYHYEYDPDPVFLRERLYPVFRESCLFFRDLLIDDGEGHLITGFSSSPENTYIHCRTGQRSITNRAPAMDTELLRDLFRITSYAIETCQIDDPEIKEFAETATAKLRPLRLGRKGQLLEWDEEHTEVYPGMFHKSHLYGFYPSDQIREGTKEAEGVRKSLELRNHYQPEGLGGWGEAWDSCLWARFRDAEKAYAYFSSAGRVVHPNLFSLADSPLRQYFQIDANFGAGAAVVEMLMQSHEGFIRLLPALPEEWSEGSVRGMRARGGFELDFDWKDGRAVFVCVTSLHGRPLRIYGCPAPDAEGFSFADGLWETETVRGGSYVFGTPCAAPAGRQA